MRRQKGEAQEEKKRESQSQRKCGKTEKHEKNMMADTHRQECVYNVGFDGAQWFVSDDNIDLLLFI